MRLADARIVCCLSLVQVLEAQQRFARCGVCHYRFATLYYQLLFLKANPAHTDFDATRQFRNECTPTLTRALFYIHAHTRRLLPTHQQALLSTSLSEWRSPQPHQPHEGATPLTVAVRREASAQSRRQSSQTTPSDARWKPSPQPARRFIRCSRTRDHHRSTAAHSHQQQQQQWLRMRPVPLPLPLLPKTATLPTLTRSTPTTPTTTTDVAISEEARTMTTMLMNTTFACTRR